MESLDASELLQPRKIDGGLPEISFLMLKDSSRAYQMKIGCQFFDSDAVGEILDNVHDNDGHFYNLQGIPVENPARGFYIHNGRIHLRR